MRALTPPAGALVQLLPPLQHLSARLLLTAPPGVQLQAAQRFFDTHMLLAHAAAERLLACSSNNSGGGGASHAAISKEVDGAKALLAAAEGALLCMVHALRMSVQGLSCAAGAGSSASGRGGEGQGQAVGCANQGELRLGRDHGPACLSAVLGGCALLSCVPALNGGGVDGRSGSDGSAATALRAYVLCVVAEVLQLQGSCNHEESRAGSSLSVGSAGSHSEEEVDMREGEEEEEEREGEEEEGEEGQGQAGTAAKLRAAEAAAEAAAERLRAEVVDALQAKAAEGLRVALQEGGAAEAHPGKVKWAHQVRGRVHVHVCVCLHCVPAVCACGCAGLLGL